MSLGSKELFHSNVLAWLLSFEKWRDKTSQVRNLFKIDGADEIFYIFREKQHFDLLIVYGAKQIFSDDLKSKLKKVFYRFSDYENENDEEKIDDYDDEALFSKDEFTQIKENIKFIAIENKFKSVPYKKQFDDYDEKIAKGFSVFRLENPGREKNIKLSAGNTKKIIFAPKFTLDYFSQKNWQPVSYEDYICKLENAFKGCDSKNDDNVFVVKKYIDMLDTIVNSVLGEMLKSDLKNPKEIPDSKNTDKLAELRIDDLYKKMWCSSCLEKINGKLKEPCDFTQTFFLNGSAGMDWKKIFSLKGGKKIFAGVQIQYRFFRISLEPAYETKTNFAEDENTLKEIRNWAVGILNRLDRKCEILEPVRETEKIRKFGSFKYMYRTIKEESALEKIAELVQSALVLINRDKSTLENLKIKFGK